MVVEYALQIRGIGIATFFRGDPSLILPLRPAIAKVVTPEGQVREWHCNIEAVLKVPSGEALCLLFPDLLEAQVPVGSSVEIYEKCEP